MTLQQKIDFMITVLELTKEEVNYAEKYQEENKKDNKFYNYGHFGYNARNPNGTLIRENLKTVARMARMFAKDITLSPYCSTIYKENRGITEK